MRKYWRVSPKGYAESAITVICDVVTAYRQQGDKTHAALELMAPDMDIQPRRVRRLFERDRDPYVDADEYTRILLGAARVLRRIADMLRERSDRWEAHADMLELRHRQLVLWGNGPGECDKNAGAASLRRAA